MEKNGKITVEFGKKYEDLKLLKRRWFPLWKLDGYVLKEFLIKYAILMLVFVLLFILSDVYRDIQDFLDANTSWQMIVLYLLYRLPSNICFVMPISMLLGCMWTMATFGKNLEVTAMRASGVSLFRCGGAIFAVGLLMSGVNIYFNELLIPKTSVMAENVFADTTRSKKNSKKLLTYKSDDGTRQWLFQLFVAGDVQENVTVKTTWSPMLQDKLLGDPAAPEYEKKLQQVLSSHYPTLPRDEKQRQAAVKRLFFERKLDFDIKEAYYDYEKSEWVFASGTFVSYDRIEDTLFKASRGTMLLHQPVEFKGLRFNRHEIKERPQDILNAVKEKDNLSTPVILQILRDHPNMPEKVRCIYETVLYYRLAFPWSCFLAVFLGVPLATRNERTGSMLAMISAIALIVIYIVVAQLFLMIGKSGALDPMICGLAPTIAFIVAGAIKIVHDRV
ncbi:MAG: YjgP/YjgQ family permease [Lentisphaerae bacterium]|nr:YjgP/YjgQ family permease [Lentisphaerota bacterium]